MGSLVDLDLDVVFPCHPRTRARLAELGLLEVFKGRLRLVEPLPYFRMLGLVRDAGVVLTDSGVLQKEAFWLGTPCVTLRNSTEWVETVEAGVNVLVGWDRGRMVEAVWDHLGGGASWGGSSGGLMLAGASRRILEGLASFYG